MAYDVRRVSRVPRQPHRLETSDDHAGSGQRVFLTSLEYQSVKIYVGNINFQTDETTLRGVFEEHGTVDEVAVITDRDTGRPRGFAFVTMADDSAARAAIEALNGKEMDGRTLNVNEARAKTAGGGGGGGGRDSRRGGW